MSIVFAAAGCRATPVAPELLLEAFASEIDALERALADEDAPPAGGLRFALAFGTEADLDLFVTGPLYESVYFANTPSGTGGALEADLRCDAPTPRIESVHYADPLAGNYRVGIDFPRRCDEGDAPVPFVIRVVRGGETSTITSSGIIYPGEFLTIVLETQIR